MLFFKPYATTAVTKKTSKLDVSPREAAAVLAESSTIDYFDPAFKRNSILNENSIA